MPALQPIPEPDHRPYIIAHRGISAKFPENTLAAFEHAAQTDGIDMIELDVRLSKDEEVIVFHDRSLQRTSTGNGPARNYSLDELKHYDAGSWFHPSFSEQRIPTLREVLHAVGGKLFVNIEIKSDWGHREPDGLVERKVLEVVEQCNMNHRVVFSSFNHHLVDSLKKISPSSTTGVLFHMTRDMGKLPSMLALPVKASVYVCAKRELTRRAITDAHAHGIAVYVYTLNSIKDAQKVLHLGVDGIMSNNADDIVPILKDNRSAHEIFS
ncbi:MAG TPA: glycerophosphodiester phosphodiesterase family protein [Bacteroidota bacterium]|nr:glycerophosphodiester phosphodiesterase family protein [Bacteroidota bacterium]